MSHTLDKSSELRQGILIFVYLAVLTALEFFVAVSFVAVSILVVVALVKAGLLVGTQLDPSLQQAFRKVARYTYVSMDVEEKELVEVELDPRELKEGMHLSRDFSSGSGVLLLSRGIMLDDTKLAAIRRNYLLDAPSHGVFVVVKR